MFIAIVGPRQAGKSAFEEYLVSRHGFISLKLDPTPIGSNSGSFRWRDSTLSAQIPVQKYTISSKGAPADILVDHDRDDHVNSSFLFLNSPTSTEATSIPHPNRQIYFLSTFDMLDHATRNWKVNYVTTDLVSYDILQEFIIRPFFLLTSIDAPVLDRFERINRKSLRPTSLEQFLREHDQEVYGYVTSDPSTEISPLQTIEKLVNLRIINSFRSLRELHSHLDSIDILNPDRLRPRWDTYFMHLASLASHRSNCMKRRVGAILVRHNRILATGYNGTARGLKNCNDGGCPRCNSGGASGQALDECVCLHAEENALLEAGRDRIGDGTTLYCNTCPCLRCCVKIIQAGVREVVYHLGYKVDDASARLFMEAGVELRRYAPAT